MPTENELRKLQGKTLTVEELFALFEETARDLPQVRKVKKALADVGLGTVPSFATAGWWSKVNFVPLTATQQATSDPAGTAPVNAPEQDPELPPMVVGSLPAARNGLDDAVAPGTALIEATTRMMAHRIGQVPVVDGFDKLHGVVTWESIAAMNARGVQGSIVDDAFEQGELPQVGWHDKLLPALERVRDHGYILVRKPNGDFSGMITRADLAERFGVFAGPFYVIGEIERTLRAGVRRRFTDEDVKDSPARARCIDELTLGSYWHFLNVDAVWSALNWPQLSKEQFLGLLDEVTDIRNAVMHFDPKPLDATKMRRLELFAAMLRALHF